MIFTENYEPRIDDYDRNGGLSLEAILKILENSGNHHTQKVSDKIADNGIAWILAEWQVELARWPALSEELYIETWVHGKAPSSTVYRDFIVSDKNGQEFLRANAKFALFNLNENCLVRISPELFASYDPEERTAFETNAPRLREPEQYEAETPILLRRSDIDFNGHVHNTHYLDFALEALPIEEYEQKQFSSVRILYRSPVKPDDKPVIKRKTIENGFVFGIYSEEKLCTLMELKGV